MDKLIEGALKRAKHLPEGKTGVVGIETRDGMVCRIEYHTTGKTNICDDHRMMTLEHWDWERAGCKNNEEWRRHLNKEFWKPFTPGLIEENTQTQTAQHYERL